MTNLAVINHHGSFVVDSRLIAGELGIEHRALRQTIDKYLTDLQGFGVLTFEMSKPLEGSTGGRPELYCYLNENQATFLMTLSRNTPAVVQCKKNLVQAFSNAKGVITGQHDRIRELELELELRKTEQKLLDTRNTIVNTCPESIQQRILGYQVIKETEIVETVIDRSSGESSTGVGITYIARRLGFKSTAQCWKFLDSIGYGKDSGYWKDELIAQHSPKLSRDDLYAIEHHYPDAQRQLFLGE
jgi:phage regulator Rha-like protein